jgi:two-component system sensor histidine kinase YesM
LKKKNDYQTSNHALIILVADKAITLIILIILVILHVRFHWLQIKYLILLLVLYAIQMVIYGLEVKRYIYPIRKLEKTVAMMEVGTYSGDENYFDSLEDSKNGLAVDRLINRVKLAIQSDYTSQMLKSQAEMHALQSQINPHFLYNTLEIIRSHAIAQKSNEIAEMTEALATLFRYSISSPGEMATFAEEMENVNNYLVIQQYRFPAKFKVIKQIEAEPIMDYHLPRLTIQPIVENAIHHGLETKMGVGTVTIRAYSTQSRFIIEIADDGLGMSAERLNQLQEALRSGTTRNGEQPMSKRKNSGIALLNVNQRLKFYFGSEYGLKVYCTQNVGTLVEISLPKI